MLGGVAIPSYATYTQYQKNYGKPFEYKFNAEKATALLKEAKFPLSLRHHNRHLDIRFRARDAAAAD